MMLNAPPDMRANRMPLLLVASWDGIIIYYITIWTIHYFSPTLFERNKMGKDIAISPH
jgi:hypothetical protein